MRLKVEDIKEFDEDFDGEFDDEVDSLNLDD